MITQLLFPEGTNFNEREANGLALDATPSNCTIIDDFHDNHYPERRHYLVKMEDDTLVHFRLCATHFSCNHGAFAAVMGTSRTEAEKESLVVHFQRVKESFTQERE